MEKLSVELHCWQDIIAGQEIIFQQGGMKDVVDDVGHTH